MRNIVQKPLPEKFKYEQIVEQFLVDALSDNYDFYRNLLVDAAKEYSGKTKLPLALHEIEQRKGQYKEVVGYYTDQVVNGDLRFIYDIIRSSSIRCPHCGCSKVTCLDHYLPKEKFPLFSIYPKNLIPTCKDCNEAKGTYASNDYKESLLNPYFDDLYSTKWLGARVSSYNPICIEFFVLENILSVDDTNRAKIYMKKLKLQDTFESSALDEISGILWSLKEFLAVSDTQSVKDHLCERAKSWSKLSINCWQRALYEGLSIDEYFCSDYLNTVEA
ncbi:hypothetical protein [Shewanella algae]|uniref:hypothetical protein n=1 Tax=Shewanella algae TaxID=38313 RepID=UPI00313E87E5